MATPGMRGYRIAGMGFQFMRYTKAQDWFANTQGNFTFNGAFTGYD
jgi:hypothetical protein